MPEDSGPTTADAGPTIDGGVAILSTDTKMYSFGAVAPGQTASQDFAVMNTGDTPSGPLTVSLGGDDSSLFSLDASKCQGMVLAAGDGCTVTVGFSTDNVTVRHATLGFTALPGGSASVALDGSGLSPAALSADPPSLSFGTVTIGSNGSIGLNVHNGGDLSTGTLSRMVMGTNASLFTTTNDSCSNHTLAAGDSCTLTVVFTPTSSGDASATLTVGDGVKSAQVPLSGKGATPGAIMLTPSGSIALGTVSLGSSAPSTITVKNTGGTTLNSMSTVVHGTDAAAFPVDTDNCGGKSLAAGATCTISIHFAPTATGDKIATLTVSAASGATASDTLSGTGKAHLIVAPDTTWCGGIVSSTNGLINCGATCQGDVTTDVITLTALPVNQASRTCYFDAWSELGCTGTGPCVLQLSAATQTIHTGFSPRACVDPGSGSDSNPGSCSSPFKTIAHAVTLATTPGDTIQLKPGVYSSASSGEAFPIRTPPEVALVGDESNKGTKSGAQVSVVGHGFLLTDSQATYYAAIAPGVGSTIAGIAITDDQNMSVTAAIVLHRVDGVTIRNNTVTGSSNGIFLDGSTNVVLASNNVSQNTAGLNVREFVDLNSNHFPSTGTVRDTSVTSNKIGVVLFGDVTGVDFGGTHSPGRNRLSCNTAADLLVATNGPVSLKMNYWDHLPQTTKDNVFLCPDTSTDGTDICGTLAAVDVSSPLGTGSCP